MTINSKTIDLAIAAVADDCLAGDMREFLDADPEHSQIGRKAEKKIQKNIKRIDAEKNVVWQSAQNIIGKAAMLILAVSAAIFGLMMTSEAFRTAVGEFWEKFYEDHIGIYIEKDDSSAVNVVLFDPEYVPDGWTVEVIDTNDYTRMVNYTYDGDKGVYIIQKTNTGGESVFIDDNYESSEMIRVYGDIDGQLYRYSDKTILIYVDDGYIYTVTSDVPIETTLDILRNNR